MSSFEKTQLSKSIKYNLSCICNALLVTLQFLVIITYLCLYGTPENKCRNIINIGVLVVSHIPPLIFINQHKKLVLIYLLCCVVLDTIGRSLFLSYLASEVRRGLFVQQTPGVPYAIF